MMSNLGMRIQQARKVSGLSLRALADLTNLSYVAIKKYEDGEEYPSSDILIKLSKVLKVRVDFFFRPIKVTLEDVKFRMRKL
ncbi:MAG: helix-turn-helix transcriptional regulator [Chlamydiae bacterium]|nr:helix-turn-helix transcriptional regulator [Chlamydiota bacterium]